MTEPDFVPFRLERWFAAQPRDIACDLTSSGAPAIGLPELLALATDEERELFRTTSLGYGPAAGSQVLRRWIASRYEGVPADDVTVTSGAIEALHLAVSTLVRTGDEVVVQEPTYPAVAGLARSRGACVRVWQLDPERSFRPAVEALAPLLSRRTRLVAITQPNSPTGSVTGSDDLRDLVGLLEPLGIWLLCDEVYRDLVIEPGLVVPSAVELYERALSIGDVAKPFGLGGLRIGWIVVRDAEARRGIALRRDYTTLSIATPSDALAAIALAHAHELLAGPIGLARRNLGALADLAARDHVISFATPRAGVTAFVRVPDAAALQRRLAEVGVIVVPGDLYGHADRVRIGLATAPERFAFGLERIAALV